MPLLDPMLLLPGQNMDMFTAKHMLKLKSWYLSYFSSDLTNEPHGLSDVADAAVLRALDPIDVRGVGIEDLHLQPQPGESEE